MLNKIEIDLLIYCNLFLVLFIASNDVHHDNGLFSRT